MKNSALLDVEIAERIELYFMHRGMIKEKGRGRKKGRDESFEKSIENR